MEIIELESWEEFEQTIENDPKRTQLLGYIFRGQEDAEWELTTTLERFLDKKSIKKNITWKSYHDILASVQPPVSSLTNNDYEFSSSVKDSPRLPSNYRFMVYLRHHGFPSPLLDWTRSPFVAAYFAFKNATLNKRVAIYCFNYWAPPRDQEAFFEGGNPYIQRLGPNIITHKRHYQQQCEYTICYKRSEQENIYLSHEDTLYSKGCEMKKFILPGDEREKVLEKLDLMNVNAFSLFGSEDSLMETLAQRSITRSMF